MIIEEKNGVVLVDGIDIAKYIKESETEIKRYRDALKKIEYFIKEHDKSAGNLYYKYNGKYLLSEIKEDIKKIVEEGLS